MTPPPGREAAFNAWYDEEHIPHRMRIAGFSSAQRYRDGETQNYLAVYEMTSDQTLNTPDYAKLKTSPSDRTRDMLASDNTAAAGLRRLVRRRTCRDAARRPALARRAPLRYF
jgi:hypothetical protein